MVQTTTRSDNNNIISDQHDTNLDVATVKSGDTVTQSGYYKYLRHSDSKQGTTECSPLPAEAKRYFVKGIKAHGIVACNHDIEWVKLVADAALAAGAAPPVLTVGTPYSRVVVRAKSTVTDTPGTVRVRHRGEYKT